MAITGHMGSAVYIAAIAIGGSMFSLLYWLFAFLRMGSSGITAQAFGAGNFTETSLTLYRSLIVSTIVGVSLIAFQYPIERLLMVFLSPENDVVLIAQLYFHIGIWGAPAFLGTFALTGWFLGMQDSKAAMYISLIINITNISLSLFFVYVLNLGISGVAAGTLIAQWTGYAIGLILCCRRRYKLSPHPWKMVLEWDKIRRFFAINIDIFFRTLCLVAVTLWFIRAGANQNNVILAVNTLLMQLFLLFSYFMDGFAFAGEALAGRFIGERNNTRLSQCINALFGWGMLVATTFTLVYAIGGQDFLSLLSDDTSVINQSGDYIWWAVAIPFAGFVAFTWDGIFIGATLTRPLLLSMFIAALTFFGTYYFLFEYGGNHTLWGAFISYLVIRGIILTIASRRYFSRHAIHDNIHA